MTLVRTSTALLLTGLWIAAPAHAFHKKTAIVVPITTSGDTDLPRIPPQGRRSMVLVRDNGGSKEVVAFQPHKTGDEATLIFGTGDNARPAVAFSGRAYAWDTDADPLGSGAPGRQVIMSVKGALIQVAVDPTGTSINPAIDKAGRTVAFESEGDLAGIGNSGARQIFLRDRRGQLVQVTGGEGESRNAMLSARGRRIVYQSTTDPVTFVDTGVDQIWTGRYDRLPAVRITAGAASSLNPTVSDDGRLVVFESLADLADDGSPTGVSRIFAYDTRTETFAQITDPDKSCYRPSANKAGRDWRIAFVCDGEAQFFMLREDARYRVQTPGGTTQSIIPEMGSHFALLSTTANLFSGGTTTGHRIYMVNLYQRPAEPIPGTAIWFPFQGIRPL